MPRNDDGEYELVMGNKQLLSIVFVLFVLFGVVFAMGYVVGRNSAPEAAAAAEPVRPKPRPETVAASQPPPAPAEQAPAETPLAPGDAKVTPPETKPVAEPAAETRTPAAPPPTPPVAEAAKQEPPPAESRSIPHPGETFLQVHAVKRQLAETMADVLVKKGFPALIAPVVVEGQTGELYRVLVGPLKGAAEIAKTRRDLEAAGFPPPIKRQY